MRIPDIFFSIEDFSLKFRRFSDAFLRFKLTKFAKKNSFFFLVCFLCLHLGNAQETPLKHTVTSGENINQIAENYKVTVAEIESLNPSVAKGVKENDVLLIPSRNGDIVSENIAYIVQAGDTKYSLSKKFSVSISELENQNPQIVGMLKVGDKISLNSDAKKSPFKRSDTTYVVKNGDTKFGLSKEFEMSIEMLEQLNPHIVPTLMVGQILSLSNTPEPIRTEIEVENLVEVKKDTEVPSDSFSIKQPIQNTKESVDLNPESQSSNDDNSTFSYISHTIQPGETLYGLSKQAGMSIDNFLVLNPKLSASVQSGMVIKMPNPNFIQRIGGHISNSGRSSNYSDLTKTLNSEKQKKLVFLLPFSETSFNSNDFNTSTLSDYQKGNRDFFRGALLAVESAKALGLKVELEVVNIEKEELTADLLNLANHLELKSPDAIILPHFQEDIAGFTSVFADSNVPVISTSNLLEKDVATNIYEAIPSVQVYRHVMLDYLSSLEDATLIVLNDKSRYENRSYILSKAPSTQFLQVNENGTFDGDELIKMFRKNSKNYVILDTDKNGVFISATNILLREMSNFKIQLAVLEPTLIPNEDDVSRKRFVILDLLYPSMTRINPSDEAKTFREAYKKEYNSEPVSIANYGFDIIFDTILRLFQSESFEESIQKVTEYGSLKIQYSKNERGFYSNYGVNIFQYETNDRHILIK